MTRLLYAALATIALATAFVPSSHAGDMRPLGALPQAQIGITLAAQNNGTNWPSKSCGCSGVGRCYASQDGKDECKSGDGTGNNACQGTCSWTKHGPGSGDAVIMRPSGGAGGGGGVLRAP